MEEGINNTNESKYDGLSCNQCCSCKCVVRGSYDPHGSTFGNQHNHLALEEDFYTPNFLAIFARLCFAIIF